MNSCAGKENKETYTRCCQVLRIPSLLVTAVQLSVLRDHVVIFAGRPGGVSVYPRAIGQFVSSRPPSAYSYE